QRIAGVGVVGSTGRIVRGSVIDPVPMGGEGGKKRTGGVREDDALLEAFEHRPVPSFHDERGSASRRRAQGVCPYDIIPRPRSFASPGARSHGVYRDCSKETGKLTLVPAAVEASDGSFPRRGPLVPFHIEGDASLV